MNLCPEQGDDAEEHKNPGRHWKRVSSRNKCRKIMQDMSHLYEYYLHPALYNIRGTFVTVNTTINK
jgi:hypothetical protein